jgi:cytochrome b561
MAFCIFVALALGLVAHFLPRGAERSQVLFVHKSFGVAVFALLVIRVILRLAKGAPSYREPLGTLNAFAAHAAHGALYLLMILMPLSGYTTSSAGGNVIPFFGLFDLPSLAPSDKALAMKAAGAHLVFAWAIAIVLVLHVAGALWHAYVRRDEVMDRMWPGFARRVAG